MSEIPEDIMEGARVCYGSLPIVYDGWDEDEFVLCIARAILAERERCAGIAEDHASTHDSRVADWIASAIRNHKT